MPPLILATPFGFDLDLSFWQEIFSMPTFDMYKSLFAVFGWPVLALIFFWMGLELWNSCRVRRYFARCKWVLLVVDVPLLFVQSPKAVEQIFAHLSGARVSPNIGEKYWQGKRQKTFSMEIVSIEGYIQFLIRAEADYRDLVEAAVYAQYPEAEITEVEDYVANIPAVYPNSDYDIFGVEFSLADNQAYPIRTYPDFEYKLTLDVVYSDPMAAILENFSRIGPGENFWLQIVIKPVSNDWKEKGIELVKKLIAGKAAAAQSFFTPYINFLGDLPAEFARHLFSTGESVTIKKEEQARKISELTPGERDTIQAIEQKIAKIGFKTKIRALYAARKDVFNPSRCIDGFIGALNQFHIIGRNAIVPYKATQAYYAFKTMRQEWQKTAFLSVFKRRYMKIGGTPRVLNIEELATVWHFPLPFVKTPLVQKAGAKRAEPPLNLPVGEAASDGPLKRVGAKNIEENKEPETKPPEELPFG